MKIMLDVTYDYLKANETATFVELFDHVSKEMKEEWTVGMDSRSSKEVEDDKRAELYTTLSIDGRFIRDLEARWSLVENYTYEEIRRMKININANLDADPSEE